MTIKDIHIGIEQGLQKIGVFAYADIEHDELDIAINATVMKEIRNIFRDIDTKQHPNNYERNQYQLDFLRLLKVKTCQTPVKTKNGYSINLPNDYLHLTSDSSNITDTNCTIKKLNSENENNLIIGKSYVAQEDTLHNNKWYKKCETFIAVNEKFYGNVNQIASKKVANRLTSDEKLDIILNNSLTKSTKKSPVSNIVGNELTVYTNDFEINEICISYIKQPIKVSYYNNVTLDFPEDVQYYIIEKTIQHLAIRIEESQQKIVNLKSENIENV